MNNYNVQPFGQFVLRTPLFPMSLYINLLENYSSENILQLFESPFVKEAIRMASPELLEGLNKWKTNPASLSNKKKNGLELSLLKYIARMSARCTPFGLFAGCTVGTMAPETEITLKSVDNFERFTQFDMQFWVAMLHQFTNRKEVRKHLKYYPNNSIYKLGDFYRYVEYNYVKTKREHSISALRKSTLLEEILFQAKLGVTIDEMVFLLADDEDEKEEAFEFVNQLIDFQFLVSELDATLTGSDEWERVLTIFSKIPSLKLDYELFQKLRKQFLELDANLIPAEKKYEDIKTLIQKTAVNYDEKYLFQTDLNIACSVNKLDWNVSKKVLKAVRFLNGVQKEKKSANHVNFIKTFVKRYESREMALTTVLDTETGIGYLQNSDMNDTHAILENFSFKSKTPQVENQPWTAYDFILEKKVKNCLFKKEKLISLSEKDFPDFNANWNKSPATFSVMIELLNNEKIAFESSGDVSAAKLLGRFCNGNAQIQNLTNKIIEKETVCLSDKILAEIVHFPESRTGNILRRPVLREYEIAYLSNSGVTEDYTIDLNDLMISVKNDKIILRSKTHNKEVIPCLSNAHNYSNKSLPIYHFLCDLQSQDVKPIFSFSWGVLESHYDYFPRVEYDEVILSKAKWIVSKDEIAILSKQEEHDLFGFFAAWRKERQISRFVNWVHFDNTLLLDLEKEICIQLFLKSVQSYSRIILEEFLFTQGSVVKDINGEKFTNHLILSFYKEQL
ncbi:lantibiotic dehydratase family protein [Flavobacterium maritimum]|uniref:lantibiotic dehydratase family protein n=1 Tax=Flavobacterium maritimum TaxID=3149042 RepID=UPI0032B3931B